MEIGDRIKALRNKSGLNQTDFCKSIGISQGRLSDMESHKTKPSFDTLIAIKNTYNISLDWLMTGTGEQDHTFRAASGDISLTTRERELIENFRKLTDEAKGDICDIVLLKANKTQQGNTPKSSTSDNGSDNTGGDDNRTATA